MKMATNILFLTTAMAAAQKADLHENLERLNHLDLSKVKIKLASPSHGSDGWTDNQTEEAEKWYKRFLTTVLIFPGKPHVPNGVVDEFWHQHMLDSRAYHKDTKAVFDRYLHHNPYFGIGARMGSEDDRAYHHQCYDETNRQLMELFGEDFTAMAPLFPPDQFKAFDCCDDCND